MRRTIRNLSLAFTAGAFGALMNSLCVYFFGAWGVTRAFDVRIAPDLTPAFLYPRLVWGGLWALLLLAPVFRRTYCIYRGLILSLLPTAVQLFIVFPYKADKGFLGMELGMWTPAFVFLFNAVWGIFAAFWLDYTRERV